MIESSIHLKHVCVTGEEFAALQAMEEVTMKFNIEDSEDEDLKMVENSSIHSEDIDVDVAHRQRPPMFVAPPPPTEPPPEDTELVHLNILVNQVDKIDIGTEKHNFTKKMTINNKVFSFKDLSQVTDNI